MAKKTINEIESLDEATYKESFSQLLHFSFKSVNSNTGSGGIRLSADKARDTAPYVSTEGALAQGFSVAVDYASMFPQTIATHLKHARIAQGNDEKQVMSSPERILQTLENETRTSLELNTGAAEPRLRQILLPIDTEFRGYLAFTPLVSAGLAKLLRETESSMRSGTDSKAQRRLRRASVQVGGANPQNVGALITEFQRPLMFSAPQEDPDLKRALSLHYRGMTIRLPEEAVSSYIEWRAKQLQRGGGRMSGKSRVRQSETAIVGEIARYVLEQARRCTLLLERHRQTLPGESLTDPGLPLFQHGLLDHSRRNSLWRAEFAQALAQRIADYRLRDEMSLGLDSSGISGLANIIEQVTL
ncbi:hypothetical protein MIH18_05570 [Marinobacter sp. M3C]|uniref:hypothetical protein n=1 Tax=unclassified Marinobacter TaxID=83889 RepID=UPI00200DD78A|nr:MULTISPECIES: hypothetical protein [unclassified Marinobacter]MCL1477493.1 hypothetical protein [Marinobacter sp.]MCL1486018.1 hypothetical protein [Marinobacter sp.]UQG57411.1 hypothetical protein MIH16_07150 [Marinobacter sp. M4C]UQG61411.1 hypothetical protein MIH18_05570 [Marinobacter sp. M3C]UQG66215.1 hypothetical protein MIH17_07150 [Marinobacter sp. M2C]